VLLAGVPRAGRSDIIAALTRLLDPALIRVQPTLADVRQQRTAAATGDGEGATTTDKGDGATTASNDDAPTARDDTEVAADFHGDGYTVAAYAEVEVTLVELDPELEQLCDGFLEPLDGRRPSRRDGQRGTGRSPRRAAGLPRQLRPEHGLARARGVLPGAQQPDDNAVRASADRGPARATGRRAQRTAPAAAAS
jgi:hypothetical protein